MRIALHSAILITQFLLEIYTFISHEYHSLKKSQDGEYNNDTFHCTNVRSERYWRFKLIDERRVRLHDHIRKAIQTYVKSLGISPCHACTKFD